MQPIEQIDSVYTAIRKREKGFTFISSLLMISIIFMTIPFTTYLVKAVDFTSNYDQLSVNQFFYFLRDEVIKSTDLTIEPTKLTLLQPDGTRVSLEKYDDLIIRRHKGGFEIYLRHIQDVHFKSASYGLHASITTLNGDQFEKLIIDYN